MQIKFKRFFSVDSAKAIKAQGFGYLNAINYMAPARVAGLGDMCGNSTKGCEQICLGEHSGQAAMRKEGELNKVNISRINKIAYFMGDRKAFMAEMVLHISRLEKTANRENLTLAVRPNGSTDLAWESIKDENGLTVFDHFPHIQFLDYTKNHRRFKKPLPFNYHITFSRSETNEAQCKALFAQGENVAVIFGHGLPVSRNFWGYHVIDGDRHDLRFLDPKGVIVGLTPKGNKAKKDTSGFVLWNY
jgi:hypothetical protein